MDQINAVLGEQDASKSLPSALHDTVDAIRNFGNFSAHPITDATTLQIIDVEPHFDLIYLDPPFNSNATYNVRCWRVSGRDRMRGRTAACSQKRTSSALNGGRQWRKPSTLSKIPQARPTRCVFLVLPSNC